MYKLLQNVIISYLEGLNVVPSYSKVSLNAANIKRQLAAIGEEFLTLSGRPFYSAFNDKITDFTSAQNALQGVKASSNELLIEFMDLYVGKEFDLSRLMLRHHNKKSYAWEATMVKDVIHNGVNESYSLMSGGVEVTSLPFDSGLIMITGQWREGKSTLSRHLKFRAIGSVPHYWSEDSTGSYIQEDYSDVSNYVYIGEPEQGSVPFDLDSLDSIIEDAKSPTFIDSFTKSELYLQVLSYKNAVSKAALTVADRGSLRSHRVPIVMMGYTPLRSEELIGSVSNLINCYKQGSNYYVDLKTRSGINKVYMATIN